MRLSVWIKRAGYPWNCYRFVSGSISSRVCIVKATNRELSLTSAGRVERLCSPTMFATSFLEKVTAYKYKGKFSLSAARQLQVETGLEFRRPVEECVGR